MPGKLLALEVMVFFSVSLSFLWVGEVESVLFQFLLEVFLLQTIVHAFSIPTQIF